MDILAPMNGQAPFVPARTGRSSACPAQGCLAQGARHRVAHEIDRGLSSCVSVPCALRLPSPKGVAVLQPSLSHR